MQDSLQFSDRMKVELFLSARKLKNLDIISKSDTKCKVYYQEGKNGQKVFVGQTEVAKDNLNPNWNTSFTVDYIFEQQQFIKFKVYDSDSDSKDDKIGSVKVTVGEIMGSINQVLTTQIKRKHDVRGFLIIKGDQLKFDNSYVLWQWRAEQVLNTDGFFGKSDPFLIFYRKKNDTLLKIHETPFIKDTLNPQWQPFELPMIKLDHGDRNKTFRVECWDNSKTGKHHFIGYTEFSFNDIIKREQYKFILSNPKEKHPGTLILQSYNIIIKPTFLDYLRGGLQINCMMAIDFTGSNGDPRSPNSLHSIIQGQFNQYETALSQVSQILLNYDFDKRVPIYGFGAVPHFPNYNSMNVEHCFPLSGDFKNPEAIGLEGILQRYRMAIPNVEFSGPTYFAPILNYAIKYAQDNQNKDIYSVLLILTDGEIHDLNQTVDLIIKCINLPISIIIVGVGNESFEQMRKLDGDQGPLKQQQGLKVYRDLVQFVSYKDYKMNIHKLAEVVLAELPGQVLSYMKIMNKQPLPPKMVNLLQM